MLVWLWAIRVDKVVTDVNRSSIVDCTVLVSSCDRYADLWDPYFYLLRLHWPDCPFPVALITESKHSPIPDVRPLCLGNGLDWSTLLLNALNSVDTPYVLLTLEDFFLRRSVDTAGVMSLYHEMRRKSLRMLRLIPRPGPTNVMDNVEYGGIAVDAPFKVSTQAAFWHTETLRQLLVPGETAWQFEINGSLRSAEFEGFVAVWKEVLPYHHHVIERGKWFPWDYWKFSRMNIGVDPSARSIMTAGETMKWIFRKIIPTFLRRILIRLRPVLLP
jgi:hypothetical protein